MHQTCVINNHSKCDGTIRFPKIDNVYFTSCMFPYSNEGEKKTLFETFTKRKSIWSLIKQIAVHNTHFEVIIWLNRCYRWKPYQKKGTFYLYLSFYFRRNEQKIYILGKIIFLYSNSCCRLYFLFQHVKNVYIYIRVYNI